MKVYELKLQKGGKGVFRMSTVKGPAIEDTLLYFKKETKDISFFADEEKRIFYAPAMIPNLKIYRNNVNGEPAEVFYTAETVAEAQINYFRQNGNRSNNINHALEDIEGVFPFESWIIQDFASDKAKTLGFNLPNGTWIMGYKVDNNEVWKNIKEGDLDGLSIEATNLEHIFKNDITMSKNKKNVFAFFKEGLDALLTNAEKFEGEIAEVSKWWQTVVNTTFAIGDTVERKPLDGETEAKPVNAGEFELEDGRRILTDSEGVIRYIFDAPAGATDPPAATEVMAGETPETPKETEEEKKARLAKEAETAAAATDPPEPTEPTEKEAELMDEIISLKQTIAELEADKVKEATDLEKMNAELVAMRKQTPAAASIPLTPTISQHTEEKKYEDMSNYEKTIFNRS